MSLTFNGMDDFQTVCKQKLVEWYNISDLIYHGYEPEDVKLINIDNVFVVWSCKTLQNYKALLSTTVDSDGVYVEYTYNGDKQELYEDVYIKRSNTCIEER